MHESNIPVNSQRNFTGVIEINNQQITPIPESQINEAVRLILNDSIYSQGEISIAVVDNSTIHRLNKEHLGHDYETDVLSFVWEADEESLTIHGEIIVSAEMAGQVAKQFTHGHYDELLLYVIHGTLHLIGFDDKQPSCAREMSRQESHYLAKVGINGVSVDRDSSSSSQGESKDEVSP